LIYKLIHIWDTIIQSSIILLLFFLYYAWPFHGRSGERGLCLTILATFALSVYFLLGEAVRKGRRKWIVFMEESPCSVYLSLSVLQVDMIFNISEDTTKISRDNCWLTVILHMTSFPGAPWTTGIQVIAIQDETSPRQDSTLISLLSQTLARIGYSQIRNNHKWFCIPMTYVYWQW
jgi:hypothetical protein